MYEFRLQNVYNRIKEASAEFGIQRSHTIGRQNPNRDTQYFKAMISTLEWSLPSVCKAKHRRTKFTCVLVVLVEGQKAVLWKLKCKKTTKKPSSFIMYMA